MTDVDFTDDAEVKKHIERVGIEYRFGCLKEKRADSCHLLGEYVDSIERKADEAFALFKENCELRNFPPSCFKYGRSLLTKRKDEAESEKRAESALKTACDGDPAIGPQVAYSCRLLGLLYASQRKPQPALRYMERACADERDPDACWHLSSWYYGGGANGRQKKGAPAAGDPPSSSGGGAQDAEAAAAERLVEPDVERCVHYAKLACERGSPQPCANLAYLYTKGACDEAGRRVEPDAKLADKYRQMAEDIVENVKENIELNLSGGV